MSILLAVTFVVNAAAQPSDHKLVRVATEAWAAARAAAPLGGSAESVAAARRLLAQLDGAIEASEFPLQITYARSLVAAAIAAAQEERAEMELHLTHARELSIRLETSAHPAVWPMPIEEAAGELWLEVEQYADALSAYQRAVARNPLASSWLGLARSAARLEDLTRACAGYREVMRLSASAAELQEARDYVTRCR